GRDISGNRLSCDGQAGLRAMAVERTEALAHRLLQLVEGQASPDKKDRLFGFEHLLLDGWIRHSSFLPVGGEGNPVQFHTRADRAYDLSGASSLMPFELASPAKFLRG